MSEMPCEKLSKMILESKSTVFFGGAGVSTESGIPDFRSVDGLYNMKYDYPPEEILSHSFFLRNTAEFYRFYRDKMLCSAKPNKAHLALAELEKMHLLDAVITQNIDGLHQDAGSKKVFELHGTVRDNYCTKCGKHFRTEKAKEEPVPLCDCGGIIKPDVVLYEESLPEKTVDAALKYIMNAELLIVGGTSLTVYPAAGFLDYFRGKNIVLINRDRSFADSRADMVIHESIGEFMGKVMQYINMKG